MMSSLRYSKIIKVLLATAALFVSTSCRTTMVAAVSSSLSRQRRLNGDGPIITSDNTRVVPEGRTYVTDVVATDDDDDPCDLRFRIVGGADQDLFRMVEINCLGKVYFKEVPLLDENGGNDYVVQVGVEDTDGNLTTQIIVVTVTTRALEFPLIVSDDGVVVVEGTTFVIDIETVDDISSEDECKLSYSIGISADYHLFTIDECTGVVEFIDPPDFENPQDDKQDNFYYVRIRVKDENNKAASYLLSVAVVKADSDGGGGAGCFALSTTTVTSQTNGIIPMQQLQVGDKVLTKDGHYETVYAIPHYHPRKVTTFLQIHAIQSGRDVVLEVTPDHLIYVMDKDHPIPASLLKIHDVLQSVGDNSNDAEDIVVSKIVITRKRGLMAPFTMGGTLIVNNGIVASSYITALPESTEYLELLDIPMFHHHDIVHLAQAPYRLFCTIVLPSSCKNEYRDEEGLTSYAQLELIVRDWYMSLAEYPLLQIVLIVLLLVVVGPFAVMCDVTLCLVKDKFVVDATLVTEDTLTIMMFGLVLVSALLLRGVHTNHQFIVGTINKKKKEV